ncbi:ERAP1-like C-terminal domain-containing protein, partial [Cellulomonas carbonis]
ALPTAEAKAAAWAAVVERGDLANALQTSTIAGFGRVHDRALLVPYVDAYFDAIERVWTTRTNEIAQNVVVGLYPSLLAGGEVDVLARTDAWLEQLGDRHPALRRLVVEARDGVRRALAAQERDRG